MVNYAVRGVLVWPVNVECVLIILCGIKCVFGILVMVNYAV